MKESRRSLLYAEVTMSDLTPFRRRFCICSSAAISCRIQMLCVAFAFELLSLFNFGIVTP